MMTIGDLRARPGEPIRRVLARVVRYLRHDGKIRVQGPARVISRENGREVIYEPARHVFPGAFRVTVAAPGRLRIGEGLVSGIVPTIKGLRIDGLDESGKETDEGPPELEVENEKEVGRTYVVIAAQVDSSNRLTTSAAAVEILHLQELPPELRDEEGRLLRIVAVLRWSGARVESVRQVVWFDQEVYGVDGKARYRAAA